MSFDDDIKAAVEVLRKGGVILYPTDTVWGLGCDATNAAAVQKVYDIKRRSDSKAMILLVGNTAQLQRLADGIPDVAYDLIEYSDKPVTIIYDGVRPGSRVAANLLPEDGTVAVRVTHEAFSKALCLAFGRPLVSTSANISGKETPEVFSQIDNEIVAAANYVCASRRDELPGKAHPSTIMRLEADGAFKILRP